MSSNRTSDAIQGRVFVVGCPRSGTTLLQSMLAAHPQIASFPESHLFRKLPSRLGVLRALGVVSRRAKPQFEDFVCQIGHPDLRKRLRMRPPLISYYAPVFVAVLDEVCLSKDKQIWLEKTPDHLERIELIQRHVHRTKFVHIIRNGCDVVASLYEVTRQDSETWYRPWSIDRCITKWNNSLRLTRQYVSKPDHFLVQYERLIQSPEAVLRGVCDFLGVAFQSEMLDRHAEAAKSLVLENESWKADALGTLRTSPSGKFERVFNESERSSILARIESWDDLLEVMPGCRDGVVPARD